MFLAIFSNRTSIGLSMDDEVLMIKNADDEDVATEIAKEYAQENTIPYICLSILNLSRCKTIE